LLAAVVDPNSWDIQGGPASIHPFRGLIIVSQTPENLAQVERLLAALHTHCLLASEALPAAGGIPIETNPAREQIAELLAKKSSIPLTQTPIREALKTLADDHKLPVVVDVKALADAGINLDWSVSLDAAERPLVEILDELIKPRELKWLIRGHTVYVTTPERIEELTSVRLYWVGDLIRAQPQQLAELRQSLLAAVQTSHVPCAERIEPDWLVVRASGPVHHRIEAWLGKKRQQEQPAGSKRAEERSDEHPE
jgi:hypothetical protein